MSKLYELYCLIATANNYSFRHLCSSHKSQLTPAFSIHGWLILFFIKKRQLFSTNVPFSHFSTHTPPQHFEIKNKAMTRNPHALSKERAYLYYFFNNYIWIDGK